MKRKIISMFTAVMVPLITVAGSIPAMSFPVSAADTSSITVQGQSVLANGHSIIIRGGTGSNTLIYLDKGIIGTYEDGIDIVAKLTGPTGDETTGYDLSGYKLFGGTRLSGSSVDSTNITMQGGTISQVFGGGLEGSVIGDANIKISGGKILSVFGGGEWGSVSGDTKIEMDGGDVSCIMGGGRYKEAPVSGNTSVEINGGTEVTVHNVYGGGAESTVSGDTNVKISGLTLNNVYGGGETGTVTGNTNINLINVNAHWIIGGTEQGSVGGNTNVIINGGSTNVVFGGGLNGSVTGGTNVEIMSGTVNNSVSGGAYKGNVGKIAHVKIYADATISGSIDVISSVSGTTGAGSYAECEVAFYDGATKLSNPASQWVKILDGSNPTNKTATQPAALTSAGKIFNGWKKSGNSNYDFVTVVSKPLKLYANWTAIPTYTVTYDGNGYTGGTVPTDSNTYADGSSVTLAANTGNLTKAGFTFGGWSTTTNGTPISSYTMGTAPVTFYAVWNPMPTYSVTYNANGANGGSVPTDGNTYYAGQNVPLAANTGSLTKTGFSFGGWSTSASGTAIPSYTAVGAPMTLYAVWNPITTNNSNDNGTTSTPPSLQTPGLAGQTIVGALQSAADGSTIAINMNNSTMLQGEWLQAIAGKDVNMVLDMGNGIKWTINGKSVTGTSFTSLNIGVSTNSNTIPGLVINNITGSRKTLQFTVTHSGNFGFTAMLSVDLGKENSGLVANLYYYNEATKLLEFQCASPIGKDGSAEWGLTHTSSYVVVIDKVSLAGKELSAGAGIAAPEKALSADMAERKLAFFAVILLGSVMAVVLGVRLKKSKGSAK